MPLDNAVLARVDGHLVLSEHGVALLGVSRHDLPVCVRRIVKQIHPLHELVVVEGVVEAAEDLHGDVRAVLRVHHLLLEVEHHALMLAVDYQPGQKVQKDRVA